MFGILGRNFGESEGNLGGKCLERHNLKLFFFTLNSCYLRQKCDVTQKHYFTIKPLCFIKKMIHQLLNEGIIRLGGRPY